MTALKPGDVAVITGAASGVGFALAELLLQRGLRIAIADVRADALDSAAKVLGDQGEVLSIPADVSDRKAVQALRTRVLGHFGTVDLVCLNAATFQAVDPVWSLDVDRWRKLFDVNLWGAIYGLQEFVPVLLERGAGNVLVTASMSGLCTVPGSADYSSSKHALIAVCETLRADLDMTGAAAIGVTIVCPGVIRTAMGDFAVNLYRQSKGNRAAIGSGPDLANSLDPAQVAAAAVSGVESGNLYVISHSGSRQRILKRVQPILDSCPPQ